MAVGPRTVSAVLRVMGLSPERQPEGPLLMVLDDTIERRRGAEVVVADRCYPSSKTCSCCGAEGAGLVREQEAKPAPVKQESSSEENYG